jgi:hypothetical protein
MQGMIKGFGAATLLAVAAVHSGCGNGSGATGSLFSNNTSVQKLVPVSEPDAPPGINNDSPMARPASVAWTSARAKRCGFFFDPVKLRATYLAYESRQPGQDLAKIESTYDNIFKVISATVAGDADYCNESRSKDIKAELARHLAGDFNPNLPKPKMVADCGMWGCATPKGKLESKEFYKELDKRSP